MIKKGTGRLWCVMILCIAFSIGGIICAIYSGVAAHGGRGGAVAVAITFIMLFLDRGTARTYLERDIKLSENEKGPSSNGQQTQKSEKIPDVIVAELKNLENAVNAGIDRIEIINLDQIKTRNAFAAFLDWEDGKKWPLVISSVTGTLFWGFGDVVAKCLGAQ